MVHQATSSLAPRHPIASPPLHGAAACWARHARGCCAPRPSGAAPSPADPHGAQSSASRAWDVWKRLDFLKIFWSWEFLYILDIMGIHQCLFVYFGTWMDMDGYGRNVSWSWSGPWFGGDDVPALLPKSHLQGTASSLHGPMTKSSWRRPAPARSRIWPMLLDSL